ncbi:MAG: thioesterase domain-containing protein [Pseudohongiellaceae bacterium]|jgi:thioesterase domain-containing protein
MSDYIKAGKNLEHFVLEHLPLARAAGISVDEYSGEALLVSAPLDKNINDKGTAFGGSLYNLCVITAWGMTDLKAKELGLDGDIVIAKGEINYLRPLRGRLIAKVEAPGKTDLEHIKKSYASRGKATFLLEVVIVDEHQNACVQFKGKYAVLS